MDCNYSRLFISFALLMINGSGPLPQTWRLVRIVTLNKPHAKQVTVYNYTKTGIIYHGTYPDKSYALLMHHSQMRSILGQVLIKAVHTLAGGAQYLSPFCLRQLIIIRSFVSLFVQMFFPKKANEIKMKRNVCNLH